MKRVSVLCALALVVAAAPWGRGLSVLAPPAVFALDEAERLWLVGSRAFDDGLFSLASRTLGQLIERYPTDPHVGDATLLLGKARLAQKSFPGALEAFRKAQTLSPPPGRPGEARFWEAETLFRMKRFSESRDMYQRVLKDSEGSPIVPDAMYGLAWTDLELKQREVAVADFRRLLFAHPDHPTAASATFYLARTLVEMKHPDEAVVLLRSFPTKYPDHRLVPDARFLLGQALIAAGDTREGTAELRAFAQAYPSHDLTPQARRLTADTALKKGNKADVADEYKQLMAQSPPSAEALYDAGTLATRLARPRDAEAAWARLRKEFPDHPLAARVSLEQAQGAFGRNSFKEASTFAQAAAKSSEDAVRGEALVLLGESELRLKHYPASYQAFQQAVESPGQEPALRFRALAGIGLVMEEQRQWTQAAKYYDEVAAKSPDKTLRAWAKERRAAIAAKLKAEPKTAPRSAAPAPKKTPVAASSGGRS